MQLRPAYRHNKSVTHNLMKRSLGLPHIFHITNGSDCAFTAPPPPQLRTSLVARLPLVEPPRKRFVRIKSRRRWGHTCGHEGAVNHNTRRCNPKGQSPFPLGNYSSWRMAQNLKPAISKTSYTKLLKTDAMLPVPVPLPPNTNKIFSSAWLDDNRVLLGTKCHRLLVYDIRTNHFEYIKTLSSEPHTMSSGSSSSPKHPTNCFGGMRAITVNPSNTLVATSGRDCSSVAVYRLPSLAPLVLAQGVHNNWIFDMSWLSDTELAVGSRDGRMTIWDFTIHYNSVAQNELPVRRKSDNSVLTEFGETKLGDMILLNGSESNSGLRCFTGDEGKSLAYAVASTCTFDVDCGSKVRAVECYSSTKIVALGTRDQMQLYDINSMKAPRCITIPGGNDNTCMTYDRQRELLAVGSSSETYVMDMRHQRLTVMKVPLPSFESAYVRSLCFCENFLGIGTGTGQLHFLDIRYCNRQKVAYYDTCFTAVMANGPHGDRLNGNLPLSDQRINNTSRSHNIFRVVNSGNHGDTNSGGTCTNSHNTNGWRFGHHSHHLNTVRITRDHLYMGYRMGCLTDVAVGRIAMNDEGPAFSEEEKEEEEEVKKAVDSSSRRGLSNNNTREYNTTRPLTNDSVYYVTHRLSQDNQYVNPYLRQEELPPLPPSEHQMSVYTHCFNKCKSLIFTAGGPLAAYENGAFCTLYV